MSDCSRFLDRVCKLKSWKDSPGTNGARVVVLKWDAITSKFEVRLLDSEEVVKADPSHLELHSPDEFPARFPDPPVIVGTSDVRDVPTGAVVDFCCITSVPPSLCQTVVIKGSCRMIGRLTGSGHNKRFSTVPFIIHIETENEVDIVEFDKLHFGCSKDTTPVVCTRGKVVFRQCSFVASAIGLCAGTDASHRPVIVLERCTFNSHLECGIKVAGGNVTMVDCTFKRLGICVCIKEGAFVVAHHCSFTDGVGGIVSPNLGRALINSCQFQSMKAFGVQVGNGSKVHLDKCKFRECVEGVKISGSSLKHNVVTVTTSAAMSACLFESAEVGVRVGSGKLNVKVIRTCFQNCVVSTSIATDTIGDVAFTACSDSQGSVQPLLDLSGRKCCVLVDGETLIQDEQLIRVLDANIMLATVPALGLDVSHSVLTRRAYLEASIPYVKCKKCGVAEIAAALMKKCAACQSVRYCSRPCQKADWRAHKVNCKTLQVRAHFLATQGYRTFARCHNVEVPIKHVPYCWNIRGEDVLYCSRRCRDEHFETLPAGSV